MDLKENNYNASSVIFYSSFLILVSELLLVKISIQLFSIFSPLPLIFVALCINYRDFLISVMLSLLQIILLKFLIPEFFPNNQIIFFHVVISFLVLFFFAICNLSIKLKIESSNIVSGLILFFITFFSIFYLFFFNSIEHEEIRLFFKRIISEVLNAYKVQDKNNIDVLVNFILTILPSMNSLIFLTTFSFNFIFAKYILNKLSIKQNSQPSFDKLITPKWFSFLYLIILAIILIFKSNSNIWIFLLNVIICMSFNYLLEGYKAFSNFFTKINLDKNIKFLIIFLLFLFLGYVLILMLLFLGFFENLKRAKNRK